MSAVEVRVDPQLVGVEKLAGYFNSDDVVSREIPGASVEKPQVNFNEQTGIKKTLEQEAILEAPQPDVVEPCETGPPLTMLVPVNHRKGGRPTVFTPDLTEQLCMLLTIGLSRNQAAAYLGIDKSSISHATTRDKDLAAQLRHAEELADLQPELTLIAAARKNWRAAAWYLKYRSKKPRTMTPEEQEARRQGEIDFQRHLIEMSVRGGQQLEEAREKVNQEKLQQAQQRSGRTGSRRKAGA